MIRKHYNTVFPEDEFEPMSEDSGKKMDTSKVYKIKYSLNMLPSLGSYMHRETDTYTGETTIEFKNDGVNILQLCAESDEIKIFETESLQDLVTFKWDNIGWGFHLFGCMVHITYIVILILYTNLVYIEGESVRNDDGTEKQNPLSILLLIGIIYPAAYEFA